MSPGNTYTLAERLGAVWRRKWLLLIPWALIAVAAATLGSTVSDSLRLPIYGAGLAGGLAVGLALVALRESRAANVRTFRTPEDVSAGLSLPVLAAIPAMARARGRHRRKREWLLTAGAVAAAAASGSAVAWAFFP